MAGEQDAPRLLYLLDEILQGTNTAERQLAARHIIRHLIDRGAIPAAEWPTWSDTVLAWIGEVQPAILVGGRTFPGRRPVRLGDVSGSSRRRRRSVAPR